MAGTGARPDRQRVLIVDDEETIRHILVSVLEENGCEAHAAASAEEALPLLHTLDPVVALLDIVLPGKSGLDLLADIKKASPDTEVVMMTSHASAETALRAIKEGAYAYLRKPFEDLDEIWITVQRALEKRTLALMNRALVREQEERSLKVSSDVPLGAPGAAEAGSRSYEQLLEFFMDMVTKELKVGSACLMLLDETSGTLRMAAFRGIALDDPGSIAVKLGEGISGAVAARGEPYRSWRARRKRAPRADPTLHPSEGFFPSPIALSVAIKTETRILGVFNLGGRRTAKPFNEGDVTHLTALGHQLAAAIEEARRADRLQQAYQSLKAAQEKLVSSERIKAIGQMAAGVAHDFNNTLGVILARAQLIHGGLERAAPDLDKMRSGLQTIIKTALQGAETIRRIQDYTRIRKDAPQEPVNINDAIKDAVEITRPRWKPEAEAAGKRIDVLTDLAPVPNVTGNIYELTQVVENLIFNAVDAMPDGGRISLRTRLDHGAIVVEVSDTGIGMDEETQSRLFEPFFTTKERGQGLGTSIVYGIIHRHRGRIAVRSKRGEGTTFTMTLPPHVRRSSGDAHPVGPDSGAARSARVLLLDDEASVREAYAEALQSAGHRVVLAARGEEALSIFAKEAFDLLITDLSMGGMSGFEVAKRAKAIRPSVPVILLTGWVVERQEAQVKGAGIDLVLTKPCPIEDLNGAIQKVLRQPVRA